MGREKLNLFGGQRLAREIVTTRIETSLHETGVETKEVLHLNTNEGGLESGIFSYLFLFDDLCHLSLFRSVEL